LVLDGDLLVDSHQVPADILLYVVKLAFLGLLETGLEVLHGFFLVQNLFLANTESLIRLGLTLDIFELNRDVEAALVEV